VKAIRSGLLERPAGAGLFISVFRMDLRRIDGAIEE